jgi:small subunit ribosomal protein S20
MANIKSQMKRNRQTVRRNERNKAIRSELKTRAKQAVDAAESGDSAKAEEMLRLAQKRIDMAVTKGVLHKKTAARRKSRLTGQVRSILAA